VGVRLEQLNTRDDAHPMKGHPGYQGEDVDYAARIVRRVGSPRMRLLFDVHHVQVTNGDVMRRIDQYKDIPGRVYVAGRPGRGDLDDDQEVNNPAATKRLAAVGFRGFIGREFLPARDPLAGLLPSAAARRS
jgi:hydroxypyruvate isomerase